MSCLGSHRLHHRLRFSWPVRHQPIAQRAVVAAQMDRPVQTLVDRHRLGFESILREVDLAFMLDGGIGSESTLGFQAEHRVEIQPRWHPTMQTGGLSCLDPEALVVWQAVNTTSPWVVGTEILLQVAPG